MSLRNDRLTIPVQCAACVLCGGFSTGEIGAASTDGRLYTVVVPMSAFSSIPSNGDIFDLEKAGRMVVIKSANFADREYIVDCRK